MEWKIDILGNRGHLGKTIVLITPEAFTQVPDGTKLISIFGDEKTKGKDYIDQDTRGGFLAFGFLKGESK